MNSLPAGNGHFGAGEHAIPLEASEALIQGPFYTSATLLHPEPGLKNKTKCAFGQMARRSLNRGRDVTNSQLFDIICGE